MGWQVGAKPCIDVSIKVQALCTNIMLYGMEVWGPLSRTDTQPQDAIFKDTFAEAVCGRRRLPVGKGVNAHAARC
jgi:hypothetical protein